MALHFGAYSTENAISEQGNSIDFLRIPQKSESDKSKNNVGVMPANKELPELLKIAHRTRDIRDRENALERLRFLNSRMQQNVERVEETKKEEKKE